MKNTLFLVLLVSAISCSTKNKNEISLFNGYKFKLYEGEANSKIESKIKNNYTKYFNNQHIQIPLFKYIKNKNYEIFIGIPYNTSIKEIKDSQLQKKDSIMNFTSDSLFNFKKYFKDGFIITEYTSLLKNNSLIFVTTLTCSKELSDSLFNEKELSRRIIAK